MSERDREAVLSILRAQEDAIRRGDAHAAIAAVAADAVLFELAPPLQFRAGDRDGVTEIEAWFDTWDGRVTVEMANPTVIIEGDLAVVFALSHMQGTKKGGDRIDSWNRRTVVLQRTADRWQIVHEHGSYPMMMDGSARAATDLKP